ncbi:MAG TPA: hypothetical protein VLA04_02665 [Verrucomicrobiae bacterium]|nr:hypothetical protein [Verrucomicrobiae bacterium]
MNSLTPTFGQLKKAFLDSGYEIRLIPAHDLERLALDAPFEVKRHLNTNIMGLIMPDENTIGIAKNLPVDERATTLLHEIIHLFDEEMGEEEVENLTLELEGSISPEQFGFLQFLVS